MSSSVAKPIIKQIKDRQDALDFFGQSSETFDFIDITNILLFVYPAALK